MVFVRNDCKVIVRFRHNSCLVSLFCWGVLAGHCFGFLQIFRFCRSKCRNAFKKKKNPRKTKWTKAFRKSAGKDLAVDPSFEFEKRRNVPVKYDRDLWQKSVEAMKKVEEIRSRRQALFINNRLDKSKEVQKRNDAYEVTKNMGLIRSPAAGMRRMDVAVDEEMNIALVPASRPKQREARVLEEMQDSDKEMDLE